MTALRQQLRDSVAIERIKALKPGDWVMFAGDTRPEVISEVRGDKAFFRNGAMQLYSDLSDIIEVRTSS